MDEGDGKGDDAEEGEGDADAASMLLLVGEIDSVAEAASDSEADAGVVADADAVAEADTDAAEALILSVTLAVSDTLLVGFIIELEPLALAGLENDTAELDSSAQEEELTAISVTEADGIDAVAVSVVDREAVSTDDGWAT